MAIQLSDPAENAGAAVCRVLGEGDQSDAALTAMWEALLVIFAQSAEKCCAKKSQVVHDADDVTQLCMESCIKILRTEPENLLAVRSWSAWSCRLAKNELIDRLRKDKLYRESNKKPPQQNYAAPAANAPAATPRPRRPVPFYPFVSLDHPSGTSEDDARSLHETLPASQVSPEDRVVSRDLWNFVQRELDAIPDERRRKAFRLWLDGWQYREIAAVCDVSVDAVTNWINRVRAKIVSTLGETPSGRDAL